MAINLTNQTVELSDIIASASLFNPPFTINFWFSTTIVNNSLMHILSLTNPTDAHTYGVYINTNNGRMSFRADNGTAANATITSASYSTGTWAMITAVATSTSSRTIYLNAANGTSNTTSKTLTTPNQWYIGGNHTDGSIFDGNIAEFAVWNVALGTADITSLYTRPKATMVRSSALKIYTPLIRNMTDMGGNTTSIATQGTLPVAAHIRRYG